jgi:hypothetical protein
MTTTTMNPIRKDDAAPDTMPDTNSELLDAVEWLRRAGVVKETRPRFRDFFEELARSGEGDAEP